MSDFPAIRVFGFLEATRAVRPANRAAFVARSTKQPAGERQGRTICGSVDRAAVDGTFWILVKWCSFLLFIVLL